MKIEGTFFEHEGNYGCPRIYREIRSQGLNVNKKRVERIMRDSGLIGKAAKLYRRKALPQ